MREGLENIEWKGEKAGYTYFLLYHNVSISWRPVSLFHLTLHHTILTFNNPGKENVGKGENAGIANVWNVEKEADIFSSLY